MGQENSVELKQREKTKTAFPKKYKVIMHNDDFTTMDFVVEILVTIFHKSLKEAEKLMLYVHEKGSAVAGIYPYDIARTKVSLALQEAKKQGFPFQMTLEEE